jgi:hypothetical protein
MNDKMATLVGAANFVGDILIVNGSNPNSGAGFDLCYFIEKYEPEYLANAIGYAFYLDIIKTITDNPDDVPDAYANLVDGTDYEDERGVLRHWKGLKPYTAGYIYYFYKRNDFTSSTGVGEANAAIENGTFRTSDQKMVRAYNDSIDGVYEVRRYLKTVAGDFPLYDPNLIKCNFYGEKLNVFGL